jgi:hypothetical protein
MKKVIGIILLIVCAIGIYLNSNEFEIKFINQKGLNETNEAKEYVMNDSYQGQNIHQEPDDSQMTDAQRAVRGLRPDPVKEVPTQDTTKEETPQEKADQDMSDFYAPNASRANRVNSVNEPGTKFPEDTEKDKFGMLIPFVLIGILGIYFVTRKKPEKE